jgi:HTH-type transcriptional regulator/antitoxin HigA
MVAAAREINQNKYAKLLAKTLPVVIKTEEENEAMLLKIGELMDKGDRMTPEELALVELMTELVEAFEGEHYQIEDAEPHVVLQHLMEANDLKQADLVEVLGSRGHTSDIVNGKRGISKEHAKALGKFFNVSPGLFL